VYSLDGVGLKRVGTQKIKARTMVPRVGRVVEAQSRNTTIGSVSDHRAVQRSDIQSATAARASRNSATGGGSTRRSFRDDEIAAPDNICETLGTDGTVFVRAPLGHHSGHNEQNLWIEGENSFHWYSRCTCGTCKPMSGSEHA